LLARTWHDIWRRRPESTSSGHPDEAVDVEVSGKGAALRNHPGNQNTSTSSNLLNGRGIKRVWSSEVRYNVNLETRDEDVVWIGEHCPFRRHIG
jgi:hypothetical protein